MEHQSGQILKSLLEDNQKNDFVSKISVAYKEARETLYWLKLLKASNYLNQKQSESLINDCEEIIRIITKIQKTMKS